MRKDANTPVTKILTLKQEAQIKPKGKSIQLRLNYPTPEF